MYRKHAHRTDNVDKYDSVSKQREDDVDDERRTIIIIRTIIT